MKQVKPGDPTKHPLEMVNINIIRELVVPLKSHTKRRLDGLTLVPLIVEFLDDIYVKIVHKILAINT
jgi:hypothetical protein